MERKLARNEFSLLTYKKYKSPPAEAKKIFVLSKHKGETVYKIAVASSDEKFVNETFGNTNEFLIYLVDEKKFQKTETRNWNQNQKMSGDECSEKKASENKNGCANKNGCESENAEQKVALVADCRAVVATKIGFNMQKQLERKAISVFDVDCTIKEALEKISSYYEKIDSHKTLRKTKTEAHE